MKAVSRNYRGVWDSLAPVRTEFLSRLYTWALADIQREIDENLRLARRVKGRLASSTVAVAEYLNKEQREAMFCARLKRTFGKLTSKKLTSPEEDVLAEDLDNRWRTHFLDPKLSGYPQLTPKIPRQGFRKLLREKLANQGFGEFDKWYLPAEWRYRSPVGAWLVDTYINTGGRARQLDFGHVIVTKNEDAPLLETGFRLTGLGLIGFSTAWDMLTPEDLPEAVDDLTALCRHLLAVIPGLLDGLRPRAT